MYKFVILKETDIQVFEDQVIMIWRNNDRNFEGIRNELFSLISKTLGESVGWPLFVCLTHCSATVNTLAVAIYQTLFRHLTGVMS